MIACFCCQAEVGGTILKKQGHNGEESNPFSLDERARLAHCGMDVCEIAEGFSGIETR